MDNSYWNQEGKYQTEYDRIIKLMPDSGNSHVVAGELIRAASRLAHDCWNNGMGNNTSGAANFLMQKGAITKETYDTVYYWTRGRILSDSELDVPMNQLINETIEFILAHPELEMTPNTEDIFEYQDKEQTICCECEEEVEDGYGNTCFDCQQMIEEEEEENICEGCDVDTRFGECECVDEDD